MSAAAEPRMLRRGATLLWTSVRAQWRPFAVSVTGATIYATLAVGATVVIGRLTDEVILPGLGPEGVTNATVAAWVAVLLAVTLAKVFGVVLRRYFGQMAQRRMQVHWFTSVTDRYLRVPLRWFDEHPAGELLAHADADAERATMAMQPLPFSLGVVVIIAVAMLQLALVDPLLMCVGLALFPGLALLNRYYTRKVEVPAARAQAQVGRVSAVAHESFEAALLVKTLGLADREQQRITVEADALRRHRLGVGRLRSTFEPALDALPSLGTVVLLWLGAWRLSTGDVTAGELVQAMTLFGILAFPFRVVGFLLEEIPRGVVAYDRLQGVLAAPIRPAPDVSQSLPPGPLAVELDDVGFAYGDEAVASHLSITLRAGEVVALVGTTGSGKTTLCHLVGHLMDPDQGTVRLGGVPLTAADPADVHQTVGLVFQESFLFADTVRANLTLGSELPDDELYRALDVARARRFVEAMPRGLDEVIGERGITLSGGQRQRLALARALLRRPRVLVLDDATSAVDPRIESAILANLRASLTPTTLMVAHRLSTIALADRVLLLADGRIAADGTHQDLLDIPAYAALVRAYEQDAA